MKKSTEYLKKEALKIIKNSQYGLIKNNQNSLQSFNRICDDVFIRTSPLKGDDSAWIVALCENHLTKFDGSDITIVSWQTTKKFNNKEEARIYCDITNLTVSNEQELEKKYSETIAKLNEEATNYFKQSVTDTDFSSLYPGTVSLISKSRKGN